MVNVTAIIASNTYNLTEYQTYGSLNGSSAYKLYKFTMPASGCSNYFNITLIGRQAHDVDLYIKSGYAEPSPTTNSSYAIVRNSTNSFEYYKWENATLGADYTIMIKHKAVDSGYEVRRILDCGGSGGPPLLPKLDKPPPPQN
jgi:hypothetical protein